MEVLTETIKFNRNINPQVGFQFQPTMKYYSNDYLFIADNIKNFYRPTRPGFKKVECWLKIAYFIIQWYITNANKNKEFYMSTRAIKKRINEDFNNQYATRTIQKGIKTCSDLGLIEIEYSKEKKSEMANPNEYINRKIKLNYKKVNELLAVYDIDEDPLYKSLPKRNRLKKFIKKRPIAYVKAVEAKYKEYKTGGRKAQANTLRNVGYSIYSSNSGEKELDNGVKQVYYLDLVKVNEKNTTCSHVASELWDLFEYEVTQEAPKEEKTLSFDVDKMLGLIDGNYKDEFNVDAFDTIFKNYQDTTGNNVEWYTRHFAYKYYKNPATLERIAICLEVSIDGLRTDDLKINNGWSNDSQIDGLKVYLYDSEGEHIIFDASAYSNRNNYIFNDLSFDITGFVEDVSEFKVYDETLGDYQATTDTDMSDYLTSEIIVFSIKDE